jgi:hypothetical protein
MLEVVILDGAKESGLSCLHLVRHRYPIGSRNSANVGVPVRVGAPVLNLEKSPHNFGKLSLSAVTSPLIVRR